MPRLGNGLDRTAGVDGARGHGQEGAAAGTAALLALDGEVGYLATAATMPSARMAEVCSRHSSHTAGSSRPPPGVGW